LATIATLKSKAGAPVQPLLWRFVATPRPSSSCTRAEQHAALTSSLVDEAADFGRKTRRPRVLRLPGVEAEHLGDGTVVWQHAYRTGVVNEVGDEQISLHRDGRVSFQRATFWDVELPALDFGQLAFDGIVLIKLAGRYAVKLGATSVEIELRVRAPDGAKELLALFHTDPVVAEQPDRTGRLRGSGASGTVTINAGAVEDAGQFAAAAKRLLDGVANDFQLEASHSGGARPPFLAIDAESIAAVVRRLE